MKDLNRRKSEKGFTLVELAIVLVIIGILLGGIIKGQELIKNAKIKRTFNAAKEISAAINTYYDRYKVYPGDDTAATTRFNPLTYAVTNGNGNGLIAVGAASTAPNFACALGTEQCDMWAELRMAGIIDGTGATSPTHPYGGAIAVSYYTVQGRAAHWISLQNIPYDVAQILDQQYDDGNALTGNIRGTANYMTATSGVFQIEILF